jgi:hypothetical protein
MMPLKNGVILWSSEYQNYYRADVYRLEDYGWLFRVNNTPVSIANEDDADFQIRAIDNWFDSNPLHNMHGTMLVKDLDCEDEIFQERIQRVEED